MEVKSLSYKTYRVFCLLFILITFLFQGCIETKNKMQIRKKIDGFDSNLVVIPSKLNPNLSSTFAEQGLLKDSHFQNSSLLPTEGHKILNAQGRLYLVGLQEKGINSGEGGVRVWPAQQNGKVDTQFSNSGAAIDLPTEGCRKLTYIGYDKKLEHQTETFESLFLRTLNDQVFSIEDVLAIGSDGYILSKYIIPNNPSQEQWLLQRFDLSTGEYKANEDCLYGKDPVQVGSVSTPSTVGAISLSRFSDNTYPRLVISMQSVGGKVGVLFLDIANGDIGPKNYQEVPNLDLSHRLISSRISDGQFEWLLQGGVGQLGVFQTAVNHDGLVLSPNWTKPAFVAVGQNLSKLKARFFQDGSQSWTWVGVNTSQQVQVGRLQTGFSEGEIKIDSSFGNGGVISIYKAQGDVASSSPSISVNGILLGITDTGINDSFGQSRIFRLNASGQFPNSGLWTNGKSSASLPFASSGSATWFGSQILAVGLESSSQNSKGELYLSEVIGN